MASNDKQGLPIPSSSILSPWPPTSTGILSSSPDPTTNVTIVGPKGEIKTSVLNDLIVKSINSQAFIGAFTPLIAAAIAPQIQLIVQSCIQPLINSVKEQQKDTEEQNDEIEILKKSKSELQQRVDDLEYDLDNLEQYGRRTSLRFHNVPKPGTDEGNTDTESAVISICEKMGVTITSDDIDRSHPIGRPNRNNKLQIICKFKTWKAKNKVFSAKKELKNNSDKIFITEDLTRYRQSIVSKLIEAKKRKSILSFWTFDGRIYIKMEKNGEKLEVTSLDEIHRLFNR